MQVKCPNCESYKTRRVGAKSTPLAKFGNFIGATGCLGMIFLLFIMPLFIPLLIPVLLLGWFVANGQDMAKGIKRFKCKACGVEFAAPKV